MTSLGVKGATIVVAEVKSLPEDGVDRQLRVGVGQILHYRELLRRRFGAEVLPVLAVPTDPGEPWHGVCAAAGIVLSWPPLVAGSPGGASRGSAAAVGHDVGGQRSREVRRSPNRFEVRIPAVARALSCAVWTGRSSQAAPALTISQGSWRLLVQRLRRGGLG